MDPARSVTAARSSSEVKQRVKVLNIKMSARGDGIEPAIDDAIKRGPAIHINWNARTGAEGGQHRLEFMQVAGVERNFELGAFRAERAGSIETNGACAQIQGGNIQRLRVAMIGGLQLRGNRNLLWSRIG